MLLDGTEEADSRLERMLFFDVNNGIARRAWARNPGARQAMERELGRRADMKVTMPFLASDDLLDDIVR
jgi:urocanate hydratase